MDRSRSGVPMGLQMGRLLEAARLVGLARARLPGDLLPDRDTPAADRARAVPHHARGAIPRQRADRAGGRGLRYRARCACASASSPTRPWTTATGAARAPSRPSGRWSRCCCATWPGTTHGSCRSARTGPLDLGDAAARRPDGVPVRRSREPAARAARLGGPAGRRGPDRALRDGRWLPHRRPALLPERLVAARQARSAGARRAMPPSSRGSRARSGRRRSGC